MGTDRTRVAAIRAVGRTLADLDDGQLERLLALRPLQRVLFRAAAACYQPDVVPGFRGVVTFQLSFPLSGRETAAWTLDIWGLRARASHGLPAAGTEVALAVSATAPDMLRIATGLVDPADPILNGHMTVSDFRLGSMLAEMLGAPPPR